MSRQWSVRVCVSPCEQFGVALSACELLVVPLVAPSLLVACDRLLIPRPLHLPLVGVPTVGGARCHVRRWMHVVECPHRRGAINTCVVLILYNETQQAWGVSFVLESELLS